VGKDPTLPQALKRKAHGLAVRNESLLFLTLKQSPQQTKLVEDVANLVLHLVRLTLQQFRKALIARQQIFMVAAKRFQLRAELV
jgi:hypothetical protein